MENVYKIKIRSDRNPRDLYPSERRYSSSIVLGLSIMFLALTTTSTLMSALTVKQASHKNNNTRLEERVEKDLMYSYYFHNTFNTPAIICATSFIMSFGLLLSSFSGILAWKRWYIDNCITWFFLSSCFSTITSSISLLVISLTLLDIQIKNDYEDSPVISLGLLTNIFITSLLGVIWSIVASNIAFKGMKNQYPDDLVLEKNSKGIVEVCTTKNRDKTVKLPPELLTYFPAGSKIVKYFGKKESSEGFPKEESAKEYQERVNNFLTSNGKI